MWINGFWQSGFWISGFWEGDALPPEVGGDLSPLAVAVQGIGFTPVHVALQGLIAFIEAGGTTAYSQEVEITLPRKKWYVKRKKQILVFDTSQDADDYIEAEEMAEKAVQKAQKTSRLARKRVRQKVFQPLPVQTIDTDWVAQLVSLYSIAVDLPALMAEQDYERIVQIMLQVQQMQDEEDLEMLLLA